MRYVNTTVFHFRMDGVRCRLVARVKSKTWTLYRNDLPELVYEHPPGKLFIVSNAEAERIIRYKILGQ